MYRKLLLLKYAFQINLLTNVDIPQLQKFFFTKKNHNPHFEYYCRLCDESLRWLIANGKMKEAYSLLKKIARKNKKDPEKILPLLDSQMSPEFCEDNDDSVQISKNLISPGSSKYTDVEPAAVEHSTILSVFRSRFLLKLSLIWMFIW